MSGLKFIPKYYKDRIKIVNPFGNVGIATLWTPLEDMIINDKGKQIPLRGWIPQVQTGLPELLSEDSPVAVVANLYGNGLSQMLANILLNPQINKLIITGADTVKSGRALEYFFSRGTELVEESGVTFLRIKGAEDRPLDPQLDPRRFQQIAVERFSRDDLEGMLDFVNRKSTTYSFSESDRQDVELKEIKFNDYPSERILPPIIATTPLNAWKEVLYTIDRFGKNVDLDEFKKKGKGIRRAVNDLTVMLTNPVFDNEDELRKYGFDPQELREYQQQMLSGKVPEDQPYGYGNRMRGYFGLDQLVAVIERLKANPLDRHSLVELWDPKNDLPLDKKSSSPCFTDLYFYVDDERLNLSAAFRTHNIMSAYLTNLYGLMGIQEFVSEETGIEKGTIAIRSRWAGINPEDNKTITAMGLVKNTRKVPLNIKDPRGYFVIVPEGDEIVARHYTHDGKMLDEYREKSAVAIKDQLRTARAISDPDHAIWLGYELARNELGLRKELKEL